MSSSRQQQQTLQTNQSLHTNGLEALINQLHQFDARGDSSVIVRHAAAPSIDISLSSSHGMSSFLQDFDLNSHPKQLDLHFKPLIESDDDLDHLCDPDDDGGEFCLVVEQTPLKHNLLNYESKRGATASRQSLQSNMRVTPSSQEGANLVVATG